MATTLPGESTHHARNGAQIAIGFDRAQRIGGLSRIVDRDIEILKVSLAQLHAGRGAALSSAWERLESAWETVRYELADESTSDALTRNVSPGNGVAAAAAAVDVALVPTVPLARRLLNWVTRVLGPAISARTIEIVSWSRQPARRAELRAAAMTVRIFVSKAASAGARRASSGWSRLQGVITRLADRLERAWSRIEGNWQTWKAARLKFTEIEVPVGVIDVDSLTGYAIAMLPPDDAPDLTTQTRLEMAKETVRSKLELIEGAPRPNRASSTRQQLDEETTSSPDMPFELRPLPWVLGALSPVISTRTMMMHHGSYYAQCVESANRLSRDHNELAGKSSLEIVQWARKHARGTELLATASEAWNHSFYWQCLTPGKKRPSGELSEALYRTFGNFSNFADQFALAGAIHVGSGWLWLTANSRKQVKILTTSAADCPEARGYTCLLGIDLWEHAYYFDHPNRRHEYLVALIDRRLDWPFAEQRFHFALQRQTKAAAA